MRRDKFQEIYDFVILPTAQKKIDERNSEVNDADNPFTLNHNFGGLYERYLLKKNSLRIAIKNNSNDDNSEKILDRHKISACLAIAIAQLHLVSDNRVDEPDNGEWYDIHEAHRMNELIAFWCGVATLMMYMATECEHYSYSEGALEKIKSELETNGMIFPPAINGTQYEDSAIRGLFYSSNFYCDNPIMLANIFFWMEQYFYKHIGVNIIADEEDTRTVKP